MKKETFYQGGIIVLLILFIIFVVKSHESYMDLLEVNESYESLIDKQREDSDKIISDWEKSYDDLQSEYGQLLVENEKLKDQMKEVELPTYDFTEAEVYLIAQCAEAEAGEKNYQAQQYITQVILNRIHSGEFPKTADEVIYQKVGGVPQFSVAFNGMMDDREVTPETLANVYEVIVHGTDLPDYVLYFYSASVKENWVNNLNTYTTLEGTVFAYSNIDKEKSNE